jgi:dTDP-4-dehydrorhamnose reductase
MILVTGGSGQVGQALLKLLDERATPYLSPTRNEFSLDSSSAITEYLSANNFTTIVHLAAETNVDLCEVEQTKANQINNLSVQAIAKFCSQNSKKLIFVSSSAVLSGDGEFMHDEESQYHPSNFYGTTKMNAEKFILENNSDYLIVRASWMLGIGDKVKKFAQIVYEKIYQGEDIMAVYDRFGSLTSATRLAEFLANNLSFSESGLVHCASSTACSRYEIAKHIAGYLNKKSQILPISNEYFNLTAPRGFSEGLSSKSALRNHGYVGLTWEDELNNFLERTY